MAESTGGLGTSETFTILFIADITSNWSDTSIIPTDVHRRNTIELKSRRKFARLERTQFDKKIGTRRSFSRLIRE